MRTKTINVTFEGKAFKITNEKEAGEFVKVVVKKYPPKKGKLPFHARNIINKCISHVDDRKVRLWFRIQSIAAYSHGKAFETIDKAVEVEKTKVSLTEHLTTAKDLLYSDYHLERFVGLLAVTGRRAAEIFTPDAFNFTPKGVLFCAQSKTQAPKPYRVPVLVTGKKDFKQVQKVAAEAEQFEGSPNGINPTMNRIAKRIFKVHKLHALREIYARIAGEEYCGEGSPTEKAAEFLGHWSSAAVLSYWGNYEMTK